MSDEQEFWQGYEEWLDEQAARHLSDEQAARHFYERSLED